MSPELQPQRELAFPKMKVRRDALRAAGRCINGPAIGVGIHGDVVRGGKCERCLAVWERTR